MEETEILIEALGQIPELVEAAKTYKASNEKTISTMSMAIKKRPEAEIPQKEVEKVTDAVKATPCALPDTDDFLKAIAGMMRPIIQHEVKEAIGATKIKVQHEHTHRHHSIAGFWNIVNDVAKKWIIGLGIFSVVSIGAFAYWVHYVRNSELFLGQRCLEIYESEYVTDQEKKEMFKDFYSVALCPKKYKDSPQALRERIRKNEAIIYEREVQSRFKKGKFKTDKKVGF